LADECRITRQTGGDDAGQRAQDLVLGVAAERGERQLVVIAIQLLQADEVERVNLSTAAGLVARDDEMDLGERPIAHPVDETDLGAEVVEVAREGVAIEEDAQRVPSDLVPRLLGAGGRVKSGGLLIGRAKGRRPPTCRLDALNI
jgi:hypothetical protein